MHIDLNNDKVRFKDAVNVTHYTCGSYICPPISTFMSIPCEIFWIEILNYTHMCIYIVFIGTYKIEVIPQVFIIWQHSLFVTFMPVTLEIFVIETSNCIEMCSYIVYIYMSMHWAISQLFLIWQP